MSSSSEFRVSIHDELCYPTIQKEKSISKNKKEVLNPFLEDSKNIANVIENSQSNISKSYLGNFDKCSKSSDSTEKRLLKPMVVELTLSKFINALNNFDGKNKITVYEEFTKIYEKKKSRAILNRALKEEYKFLFERAETQGFKIIVNILKKLTNDFECIHKKAVENFCCSNMRWEHPSSDENLFITNEFKKSKPSIDEKMEHQFFEYVKECAQQKKCTDKVIKELVLTYPYFCREEQFLKNLVSLEKEKFVRRFWDIMSKEGISYMCKQALASEINLDFKEFNVDSKYRKKQFVVFKQDSKYSFNWNVCSAKQFANALTAHDVQLISSLALSDVQKWLNDHNSTDAIIRIEKSCKNIRSWIEFQIVSELDKNKRFDVVEKFLEIGKFLLKNKNFHSLSILGDVLSLCHVRDLICKSQKNDKKYQKLELFSHIHNLQKACLSKISEGKQLLAPINKEFFEKLSANYKIIKTEGSFKHQNINKMVPFSLMLAKYHSIENFDKSEKDIVHFLSNLKMIDFQDICKIAKINKQVPLDIDLSLTLEKWEVKELFCFLMKENIESSSLQRVFTMGISSGKALIDKFTENKHIIKDWSDSAKEKVWESYLLRLANS